jgi:hypothetical protein
MEPFIILGIAAVLLVIFVVIWNQRSHRTASRPAQTPDLPRKDQVRENTAARNGQER